MFRVMGGARDAVAGERNVGLLLTDVVYKFWIDDKDCIFGCDDGGSDVAFGY